jgi:integrase
LSAISTGCARRRNAGLRGFGCTTLLFAAGVPPRVVMEILGHSQIAVTMNVYTHVSDDSRREAMGHMDRLLRRRRRTS